MQRSLSILIRNMILAAGAAGVILAAAQARAADDAGATTPSQMPPAASVPYQPYPPADPYGVAPRNGMLATAALPQAPYWEGNEFQGGDAGDTGATSARIKDLIDIEGVRENQLVGYGLVVGLNGTGDSLNASPFTRQSLTAMLERLGVNTRGATLRTKNVAAVMVTASLPPFSTQGTRIDITVSAMGDATSLQGGTLLVTPLLGADGEVYAVGQGPVAVIGFQAEGNAAKIVRGVPTTGRISNGALVEREIEFALSGMSTVRLSLRNPDLTTARRIASAINTLLGSAASEPVDPSTVQLTIPPSYRSNIIRLLTEIEQLRVQPDLPAKIVIDERSGIIVMGRDVRVATVAVAQGNLTVTISEAPIVSQPLEFSDGETVVVPRTSVQVDDESYRQLAVVKQGVTLQELVDGLNSLGIGPRDLIGILQAIKAAGALQAEIEVM